MCFMLCVRFRTSFNTFYVVGTGCIIKSVVTILYFAISVIPTTLLCPITRSYYNEAEKYYNIYHCMHYRQRDQALMGFLAKMNDYKTVFITWLIVDICHCTTSVMLVVAASFPRHNCIVLSLVIPFLIVSAFAILLDLAYFTMLMFRYAQVEHFSVWFHQFYGIAMPVDLYNGTYLLSKLNVYFERLRLRRIKQVGHEKMGNLTFRLLYDLFLFVAINYVIGRMIRDLEEEDHDVYEIVDDM